MCRCIKGTPQNHNRYDPLRMPTPLHTKYGASCHYHVRQDQFRHSSSSPPSETGTPKKEGGSDDQKNGNVNDNGSGMNVTSSNDAQRTKEDSASQTPGDAVLQSSAEQSSTLCSSLSSPSPTAKCRVVESSSNSNNLTGTNSNSRNGGQPQPRSKSGNSGGDDDILSEGIKKINFFSTISQQYGLGHTHQILVGAQQAYSMAGVLFACSLHESPSSPSFPASTAQTPIANTSSRGRTAATSSHESIVFTEPTPFDKGFHALGLNIDPSIPPPPTPSSSTPPVHTQPPSSLLSSSSLASAPMSSPLHPDRNSQSPCSGTPLSSSSPPSLHDSVLTPDVQATSSTDIHSSTEKSTNQKSEEINHHTLTHLRNNDKIDTHEPANPPPTDPTTNTRLAADTAIDSNSNSIKCKNSEIKNCRKQKKANPWSESNAIPFSSSSSSGTFVMPSSSSSEKMSGDAGCNGRHATPSSAHPAIEPQQTFALTDFFTVHFLQHASRQQRQQNYPTTHRLKNHTAPASPLRYYLSISMKPFANALNEVRDRLGLFLTYVQTLRSRPRQRFSRNDVSNSTASRWEASVQDGTTTDSYNKNAQPADQHNADPSYLSLAHPDDVWLKARIVSISVEKHHQIASVSTQQIKSDVATLTALAAHSSASDERAETQEKGEREDTEEAAARALGIVTPARELHEFLKTHRLVVNIEMFVVCNVERFCPNFSFFYDRIIDVGSDDNRNDARGDQDDNDARDGQSDAPGRVTCPDCAARNMNDEDDHDRHGGWRKRRVGSVEMRPFYMGSDEHNDCWYEVGSKAEVAELKRRNAARIFSTNGAFMWFRFFDWLSRKFFGRQLALVQHAIPLRHLGLDNDFLSRPPLVKKHMRIVMEQDGHWKIDSINVVDSHYGCRYRSTWH